jgi:sorbitol-6-phosphate 2-dehydrogenase
MVGGLSDRVALITGGGQGLGQAIALRLAAEGAHVAVADLNPITAEETATRIRTAGDRQALAIQVDVTDEAQVQAMVQRALDRFGRLDILIANAGIVFTGDVTEFPAKRWRQVIDVNLTGYFLCAKHVVPTMKAQGSGGIIQINSISGKRGSYRSSAYVASKMAGIGLTQSLALELAEHGVRVNAVCPGHLLDSPLWTNKLYKQYAERFGVSEAEVRQRYIDVVPMKRSCTYEDVCNVVAFLVSDQAGYMTGQAINVTGGQEMR